MNDLANLEPGGEYALLRGKNLYRGRVPIRCVADVGASPSLVPPAWRLGAQGMLSVYRPLNSLENGQSWLFEGVHSTWGEWLYAHKPHFWLAPRIIWRDCIQDFIRHSARLDQGDQHHSRGP